MSGLVDQLREQWKAETHADADHLRSLGAWAVRCGPVEVRRSVDTSAADYASLLLGSIDTRRYPNDPEIKRALAEARTAAHALVQAIYDRVWVLYDAERDGAP